MNKIPLPQKDLDESKLRYGALFDSNMIGVVFSDLDDTILEANDAFLKVVGYSKKDVARGILTWSAITPEKYVDIDNRKVLELLKKKTIAPFEKEYIHKKGHLVPVVVGATCIRTNPHLSVSFALDITEQKRLEQKKDEFIGTVSHELKTPLAVLKMQASLMHEDIENGVSNEHLVQTIHGFEDQIDRLNVLITDLLNLARLTNEASGYERGALFDMRTCVEKVVKDFRLVTKRTIRLGTGRKSCLVQGHEGRIMQVCTNLIANALRYSPEQSAVAVSVKHDKGKVRVAVKDSGRGISKKDQKNIFKRHYRADHADEVQLQSAGIGLHVCQEIVKQHKGTLTVVSTEGKGSTFTCTFPLAS